MSFKRSRRELSIDVAEHRSVLKNNQLRTTPVPVSYPITGTVQHSLKRGFLLRVVQDSFGSLCCNPLFFLTTKAKKRSMRYSRVSVIRLSVVSPLVCMSNLYSLVQNTLHAVVRKIIFTCTSLSSSTSKL